MRVTKEKTIMIFLMLIVISSINQVQALDNGNYYSADLVAGTVLEWNYVLKNLHLNPVVTETYKITIEVLQDVSEDIAISDGNGDDYFDYSAVLISPSAASPVSSTVKIATTYQLISSYIYPTVKVINGESMSYYEYYKQNVENPPKYEISHSGSNFVIKTQTGTGGDEFTNNIKVHEDTGILREKNFYGYIAVYGVEWTIDIEYIGGLKLASGEFISIIVPFVCISLVLVIMKRKRKKNQTI